MKENYTEKTAYQQIVELCYKYGIIATPSMTEGELRAVLDSLCAALITPSPERATLECQHSEQYTPR